MGFGFLRIRSNERTQAFWAELAERFERAIATISGDDKVAHVVSEQALMNELLKGELFGVTSVMLPRSEYVDGKFYNDDVRRLTAMNPVLINNNYVIGVRGKIERAKTWKHWFLNDDNATCDVHNLERLSDSVSGGFEPLAAYNLTTLHWKNCFSYFGGALWCHCCRWNALNQAATCKAEGYCSTQCISLGICDAPPPAVNARARRACYNRYMLFVQSKLIDTALSVDLSRSLVVPDDDDKHPIRGLASLCHFTRSEFLARFSQSRVFSAVHVRISSNSSSEVSAKFDELNSFACSVSISNFAVLSIDA
jgi:hypothetical protein